MSPRTDMAQIRSDFGRPLVVAMLATALSLAALSGAFVWSWLNPPLDKILGPYPEQSVTNTREHIAVDGKTYDVAVLNYPDEAVVSVAGEKCSKVPAEVAGTVSWKPVFPNDASIVTSAGTGTRAAGCVSFRFDNRVPSPVAAYLTALHVEGVDLSLWRITGSEEPVSPPGLSQTWSTDLFAIRWSSGDATP